MLLGDLKQALSAAQRQRGARRILQHGIDKDRFGARALDELCELIEIMPVDVTRQAHDLQAGKLQDLQQIAITRVFNNDGVSGLQQRAHHQIKCLRRALCQQHICRLCRYVIAPESGRDLLAQRRHAVRVPIASKTRAGHTAQGAQGMLQAAFVDPLAREPTAACLNRHRVVGEYV